MIVTRDNERLYLKTWGYNASRIITELASIVKERGGRVRPTKYTAIISNRNVENSEPITVSHTSYISFVLNDVYYYYQVDENPFFDFYYNKVQVVDGKYSKDNYLEKDTQGWWRDSLAGWGDAEAISDSTIREVATQILDMLCDAPMSENCRESYKKRVPNTYNNGYHMETVYKPERFGAIDF